MGMFDEIHCDVALPDDACEAGTCFQTNHFRNHSCVAIGLQHLGASSIRMAMISSRAGT